MSDHDHSHGHGHHGHAHSHDQGHSHGTPPSKSGLHKDWRLWVVVGLMLLGMVIYILTLDESLRPG